MNSSYFSEIFPYLPPIFSQPPAECADLQVIESDFARLEAETTSAEEASKKEPKLRGKPQVGFLFGMDLNTFLWD